MHLTLYHRTYPAKGAPVSMSFSPFPAHQRHTFAAGGVVYEAGYGELRLIAPDGATVREASGLNWSGGKGPTLSWVGEDGPVASTPMEVFELARTGSSGFALAQ